ncbi:MAG: aminotransferase class V-fold PLP-dependent enzyme, partial [Candidatus Peribacteraceae bacterium]|nr:aminotransferase class V-fold PLP-dependent enzyme [Candidatus Peribacteraceae bacterium]
MPVDIRTIRAEFPALAKQAGGEPLVYLDNAATTQVPQSVLNVMRDFEEGGRANVHRSMHMLAERASVAYEDARRAAQKFLNAAYPHEIIFTKNCTEGINLVAHSLGETMQEGDTVLLSYL